MLTPALVRKAIRPPTVTLDYRLKSEYIEMGKKVHINGRVITMNPEASGTPGFGIIGDRFHIVGGDDAVLVWPGNEGEVVDLVGQTVVP